LEIPTEIDTFPLTAGAGIPTFSDLTGKKVAEFPVFQNCDCAIVFRLFLQNRPSFKRFSVPIGRIECDFSTVWKPGPKKSSGVSSGALAISTAFAGQLSPVTAGFVKTRQGFQFWYSCFPIKFFLICEGI